MSKISVIILTKNSEQELADCIESIGELADEIIVVDDGSTDRTLELAKHLGARTEILKLPKKDFSEMRNFGLKKAKNKWILYVDVDERISSDLKESIKEV